MGITNPFVCFYLAVVLYRMTQNVVLAWYAYMYFEYWNQSIKTPFIHPSTHQSTQDNIFNFAEQMLGVWNSIFVMVVPFWGGQSVSRKWVCSDPQVESKEGNNKGCNEKWGFFHPNACRNSMKDRSWSYQDCRFYHLKGTVTTTRKVTKKQNSQIYNHNNK